MTRVLAAPVAFNEESKIGTALGRFPPGVVDEVLVVDDGSTDGTARVAREAGAGVLTHPARRGAGAAIRSAIEYARGRGFDVLVIMAGNDKDRPAEIPALVAPILAGEADIVQGSRFLPGGVYGEMPWHRVLATRWVHPLLFRLACGQPMTDTTNGFRAIRLRIFDDPRLAIGPPALDRYELEPYLLAQAIRLGYRVREVPVTKIYPPKALGYTKMAPLVDWWRISKPLVQFALRRWFC